jgi:NhaP-type Na+/H+ or K+/H+ antiporter
MAGTNHAYLLHIDPADGAFMPIEATWFVLIGVLLIFMALARGVISSLPMTGAMVYLVVGFILGPAVTGLLTPDIDGKQQVVRLVTEAGLVVSLFAIGLHLRVPLTSTLWRLTLRLGVVAMIFTIALMTAIGHYLLRLPLGVAIVLAAALAPTDPVLANELRPRKAGDDEPLRFALSSEGGCNDGAAWPFMLFGLALCGVDNAAQQNTGPFLLSVAWGIASGIAIGWGFGTGVVALVTRVRTRFNEALGLEAFFALGLMSACYGAALLIQGYGFLAVFAGGVALRHRERAVTGDQPPATALENVEHGAMEQAATDPELAHAVMAESMMSFAIEVEHLVELALMLLIGSVVSAHWRELLDWHVVLPVVLLLAVVRPVSTQLALLGSSLSHHQRLLVAWLGIRGVGTFYYLLFSIEHAPEHMLNPIVAIVLAAIVGSVFLHGATATTLLDRYFNTHPPRPDMREDHERPPQSSS